MFVFSLSSFLIHIFLVFNNLYYYIFLFFFQSFLCLKALQTQIIKTRNKKIKNDIDDEQAAFRTNKYITIYYNKQKVMNNGEYLY